MHSETQGRFCYARGRRESRKTSTLRVLQSKCCLFFTFCCVKANVASCVLACLLRTQARKHEDYNCVGWFLETCLYSNIILSDVIQFHLSACLTYYLLSRADYNICKSKSSSRRASLHLYYYILPIARKVTRMLLGNASPLCKVNG